MSTAFLIFFIPVSFTKQSLPVPVTILILALLFFIWIWSLFGELRTKVVHVEIRDNEITVSGYWGLGAKLSYNFSETEGFETSLLPSGKNTYEYLYLLKKGKKIMKLSEFYHRNYDELKYALNEKVKNLGQTDYSLLQDIKEIFI